MQFTLEPDLEQYVRRRAEREGFRDASQYIASLVEHDRRTEPSVSPSTSGESVGQALWRLSRGQKLGDDLTIRDLIDEGRRI